MAETMPGNLKISQIPTLSALYRTGKLQVPKKAVFSPSHAMNQKVSLFHGDITKLGVGAIVNAANKSLMGGGGVDGAIHAAAGSDLAKECRSLCGCDTGEAKMTKGYLLPASHIIHTVGPVYYNSKEDAPRLLRECYANSLQLAKKHKLSTIAFPSISTGVYGYPKEEATEVAATAVRKFLDENEDALERVVFCVYSDADENDYRKIVPTIFPPDAKDNAGAEGK